MKDTKLIRETIEKIIETYGDEVEFQELGKTKRQIIVDLALKLHVYEGVNSDYDGFWVALSSEFTDDHISFTRADPHTTCHTMEFEMYDCYGESELYFFNELLEQIDNEDYFQ